ncbi:DUF2520 domain-containing protein [Corynebacterium sp.]|uniref:Rossmann-like and DUF2520 domain-containing protein n=1 Tax=Corynebacterium sp. TaxID=1720 RepID=UPI0025BD81B3|nr:DUF2520 domain-containing protein [Corynebacterium sp.]
MTDTTPADRQEPRLSVGVISAGAVGTAVAESLLRAGHHIHGVVARSERARERVRTRLPGVTVFDGSGVGEVAQAALVVLAVPDPQLPDVVLDVAEVVRAGQIVAHTAGALGCAVLQPVTDTGALPLALHPAMTFRGGPEDADNLLGCAWGVTTDSETGTAVAELLVSTMGGVPVPVAEDRRTVYHAAMAHGANHLVTQVVESLRMLDHVLGDGAEDPRSSLLLRRILPAAVEGALDSRMAALTGPTARDDATTVLRHLDALRGVGSPAGRESDLASSYRQGAERTARAAGSLNVEQALNQA